MKPTELWRGLKNSGFSSTCHAITKIAFIASLDFIAAVQCMIHFIYHMISSLDSDIRNNINALTMTHDDSVHILHDENIIAYKSEIVFLQVYSEKLY